MIARGERRRDGLVPEGEEFPLISQEQLFDVVALGNALLPFSFDV